MASEAQFAENVVSAVVLIQVMVTLQVLQVVCWECLLALGLSVAPEYVLLAIGRLLALEGVPLLDRWCRVLYCFVCS